MAIYQNWPWHITSLLGTVHETVLTLNSPTSSIRNTWITVRRICILRRYDFCLLLLYATSVARAARIKQRSYTTCHSNILIVAMTVVGFQNMTVSKSYDIFSVVGNCREDVVHLI